MIRAFTAMMVLVAAASQSPAVPQNVIVVFDTEKGTIEMEVDGAHAPATAANFLKYVDAGFYDGGSVNRAVRPDNTVRHDVEIQVIQFQIDPARRRDQFPPIPIERTSATGPRHVDGALSMARSAFPDSLRKNDKLHPGSSCGHVSTHLRLSVTPSQPGGEAVHGRRHEW